MLGGDCRRFLNDELGGGTVMGLLWFALLVVLTGLAVDTINGLRNRTMLQASASADADAAALGDAIDLPAAAAAVTSAAAISTGIMPTALYGSVLKAGVPEE